jgi:hypothetical protein
VEVDRGLHAGAFFGFADHSQVPRRVFGVVLVASLEELRPVKCGTPVPITVVAARSGSRLMARRNGRVKNSGTDNGTEDEEEGK